MKMKKKRTLRFAAGLALAALLLGSCGTAAPAETAATAEGPVTRSAPAAGSSAAGTTEAAAADTAAPASGHTLNGIDLADYTVVTDNEAVFGGPAHTLTDYLTAHRSVTLPVAAFGAQTTGHFIYVGNENKKYGTFESELQCRDGNIYLCAGGAFAGERAADAFIAGYLTGERIEAVIPAGQSLLRTTWPDWGEAPADYTVRERIVRSCKKLQDELEYDHSLGLYYTYQNSGYKSTAADARSSGNRTTNCVIVMNWVLKDAGLYSSGTLNHKYDGTCGYTFSGGVSDAVSKYFDILPVSGKTIARLAAEGALLPGDVIFFTDHNQIITDPVKGLAMDGGRGNCEKHEVGARYKYWLGPNPCLSSAPGFIFRAREGVMLSEDKPYTPTARSYEDFGRINVLRGAAVKTSPGFNMNKISYAANATDGQVYYDSTTDTYADFKMEFSAAAARKPTYWFDANGEKSTVRDETHKYLCAVSADSGKVGTVDGFAVFSQAYGESSRRYIGDVDGFDILVSEDGKNWKVVYSVENAACEGKYIDVTDPENYSAEGLCMTHYLRADFTEPVQARYFMYAVTEGRSQVPAKAGVNEYNISTNQNYFRITEFMLFEAEGFAE